MSDIIGKGLCLGIGGTNARVALCEQGQISDFVVNATPADSKDFFAWMADEIAAAATKGAQWAVVGVPGLVNEINERQAVGPLVNVPGLSDKSHILSDELGAANPTVKKLLAEGFMVRAVNDGLLAAFAAASVYGEGHTAIASFIIGTGVGGAVVRRQASGVFRPSESLFEIGHVPLGDHTQTFEGALSGSGLHRKHGVKAEEMDGDHEAWKEVGCYTGQMVMTVGLIGGVDLVVTCGGVGSNAYEHYRPAMEEYLEKFRTSPNAVHRLSVPQVIAVSPEDSQLFEMRGAEGVMRHHLQSANKVA